MLRCSCTSAGMSQTTVVSDDAFIVGAPHCFVLPKSLLVLTACFQMHIGEIDADKNGTYLRSTEPSPSLSQHSTGAVQKHLQATADSLNNSLSLSRFQTASASPTSQMTKMDSGSNITKNDKKANRYYLREYRGEDKGVIFYKRIGGWITLGVVITALVFLTITHFSSIRQVNMREQIREPFCSSPPKPQRV